MARHESDREDLMREATALRQRVEFQVPHEADLITAGFRDNGCFSIYVGPDPVFHFDKDSRLRRAFAAGQLYRTQGTTLARLTRVREPNRTDLLRHDLSAEELREFLQTSRCRLAELIDAIDNKRFTVVAQIPADGDVVANAVAAVRRFMQTDDCLAPRIAGKR